ncbi:MAG: polysaccharide biosynthesis protein, partial [Vallitaleaceae bacterium]|nr:polysaccharide biosynthesis protein [Vallitaleaceae bacterium]
MTKQTQRFIKGTLILSIAGMLAKVISVFYKVPLEYLTGTVGLGLYQAVYPLYSVLTAAALIGIPNSISKIIAEDIAKKEYRKAHLTFRTGLFLTTGIGLFISLFLLIFGKEIVRVFPWDKGTYYVLLGLSISPAFVGISGAIRGYMQGMQEMVPTAVSQIIENTMKVLIGIGLVVIFIKVDASLPITVGGAAFGASAGFIMATLYLMFVYIRKRPKIRERIESDSHGRSYDRKRILMKIGHIAIPVTIASATFSIMSLIDSLTISNFIRGNIEVEGIIVEEASYILGLIAKAQTVINVPLVLSVSLIINIVPSISAANVQKDKNELKLKIWEGIDMAIKLALPAAVGIIVLAEPILTLLYREGEGAYYLQLYGISLVLMILAQSLTGMLQGLSKYYVPLWIVFIAAVAKL